MSWRRCLDWNRGLGGGRRRLGLRLSLRLGLALSPGRMTVGLLLRTAPILGLRSRAMMGLALPTHWTARRLGLGHITMLELRIGRPRAAIRLARARTLGDRRWARPLVLHL